MHDSDIHQNANQLTERKETMSIRNPRTGRTLKHPERFIKQLQLQLKETQKGEIILSWKSHTDSQKMGNGTKLFSLNPGDRIAIVATVLSVNGSKCRVGNLESEIEYEILETRRMPKDW